MVSKTEKGWTELPCLSRTKLKESDSNDFWQESYNSSLIFVHKIWRLKNETSKFFMQLQLESSETPLIVNQVVSRQIILLYIWEAC
jgi:hypothetical protein